LVDKYAETAVTPVTKNVAINCGKNAVS
jgi:hypothetical protein